MQIDAIVTDLDDTLLNERAELSAYTLDVLARAAEKGVRHIPASGRAARSMYPYTSQLHLTVPYIACNGSQLVTADHRVFDTVTLGVERAREIIRYARARGFYVQSYRDDDFYFDSECAASIDYQRSSKMNAVAVGDLLAFTTFPVPKLLCVNEPAEVEKTYPEIQLAFPDVEFTISKPYFLEAQPMGVNKGSALRRLADMIGLTPEKNARIRRQPERRVHDGLCGAQRRHGQCPRRGKSSRPPHLPHQRRGRRSPLHRGACAGLKTGPRE